MEADITRYFAAEKAESVLFLAVGIAALVGATWLWTTSSSWKGMAIPLVLVALVQVGVGGSIFFRTDAQVAGARAQLASDPAAFQQEESARMTKVLRGFELYKAAEVACFLLGVGLCVAFKRRELLYAAGTGLVLQSSVMLVLDLFAEKRGREYLEALQRL